MDLTIPACRSTRFSPALTVGAGSNLFGPGSRTFPRGWQNWSRRADAALSAIGSSTLTGLRSSVGISSDCFNNLAALRIRLFRCGLFAALWISDFDYVVCRLRCRFKTQSPNNRHLRYPALAIENRNQSQSELHESAMQLASGQDTSLHLNQSVLVSIPCVVAVTLAPCTRASRCAAAGAGCVSLATNVNVVPVETTMPPAGDCGTRRPLIALGSSADIQRSPGRPRVIDLRALVIPGFMMARPLHRCGESVLQLS